MNNFISRREIVMGSRTHQNIISINCHGMPVILQNKADSKSTLLKAMEGKSYNYQHLSQILQSGVDPNLKNSNGDTALHLAVAYFAPSKIIKLLLDHHADVNASNCYGNTPLHQVIISGYNIMTVNQLCGAGASLNCHNSKGDTPLHLAIRDSGNIHVLKDILKRGVDINAKNSRGRTPLVEAVFMCKDISIVKALLNNKAEVNLLDKAHCSALHYAARYKDINIAGLLFKYGAHPCINPLDCCFGDKQIINLLIRYLVLQHITCHKASNVDTVVSIKDIIKKYHSVYVGEEKLIELCKSCFRELSEMKRDFVDNNFTMDKYLLNKLFVNKYSFQEPSNVADFFLRRICSGLYENYRDLILINLNRQELLSCLSSNLFIFTLPCGRSRCFDGKILKNFGAYLNSQDLLNLLKAIVDL